MRAVGTFLALSALYLAADSAPASLPTSNSTIGTERALTVCSYVPGRVYRFHGMEWGNGSAVTLEQFMALAGPLWLGTLQQEIAMSCFFVWRFADIPLLYSRPFKLFSSGCGAVVSDHHLATSRHRCGRYKLHSEHYRPSP